MKACGSGHSDIVALLLDQESIDFNAVNSNGDTGYLLAYNSGSQRKDDVIKLLEKRSKDLNIKIP